eukprot:2376851-Rhodomonas_salina.2
MSRENYGSKDMILGIGDQGVLACILKRPAQPREGDGSVYVKTIVSGGSAERDGSVRVGDRILAVDERQASDDLCGSRLQRSAVDNCACRSWVNPSPTSAA